MANNKVQLADGTTLIDLTNDTVTAQTMLAGTTAHAANGEPITGVVNLANAGTAVPLINNGNGSVGSSNNYAREDHVHPSEFDAKFIFDGYDSAHDITQVKLYLNRHFLPGIQWFLEDGTSRVLTVWTNKRLIYQETDTSGAVVSSITWTGA